MVKKLFIGIFGFFLAAILFMPTPVRADTVIIKDPVCPAGCIQPDNNYFGLISNCYATISTALGNFINYSSPCGPKNYCPPDRNADEYAYDSTIKKCKSVKKSAVYLCTDISNPDSTCATAIGPVPVSDFQKFVEFLLQYAMAISGGIILLMLIATGYTVLTSGGNPEKLQGAKENVVAIISGLLLIVFSQVLLHAVGADIFKLPGF